MDSDEHPSWDSSWLSNIGGAGTGKFSVSGISGPYVDARSEFF